MILLHILLSFQWQAKMVFISIYICLTAPVGSCGSIFCYKCNNKKYNYNPPFSRSSPQWKSTLVIWSRGDMDDVTERLLLYCSIDIIMIPANIKKEKKKKLNISILSSYSNYRQTQLLERYDIVEFELANKKNTNKKGSWHQKKKRGYIYQYVFICICIYIYICDKTWSWKCWCQ